MGKPLFHRLSITVPANTAEEDAIRDTLVLKRPHTITGMLLHVPAGHQAQVPVWFERNEGRWLPSDGEEIRLDDTPEFPVINPEAPEDKVSRRERTEYALVGYNEDADQHQTQAYLFGRWGVDG